MSTIADPAVRRTGRAMPSRALAHPTLVFWVFGAVFYGSIAAWSATGGFLDETSRDIWQHLAALKALIANPFHPANPFVPTFDYSRHFHPYWVGVAVIAKAMGWNEWQAWAFATFLNAGALLGGIYVFARAFYRDRRGPLALLAAMALGWIFPIGHTGYHSPSSYLDGFAYPAALLVSMSLFLWAVIIRALERPRLAALIAPLAALMFATHQLGAGIGFVFAGWLALLWPDATLRNRAYVLAAMACGLAASALWPYFSPFEAVFRTGNSTWSGGVNFYGPEFLVTAVVPQAAGLIGLLRPEFQRNARPVLAALVTYVGLFLLGLAGILIATRFLMPAVLMLHIGLGAVFITLAARWRGFTTRQQLGLFGVAAAVVSVMALTTQGLLSRQLDTSRRDGSDYDAALALTRDIPDMQPIAVYDVAVWPVVATGQRALSEPWPEPGITRLAERQRTTERLFEPSLTRQQRIGLARQWGVHTLIMHRKGALRRETPAGLIDTLGAQSIRQQRAGEFLRFDLY